MLPIERARPFGRHRAPSSCCRQRSPPLVPFLGGDATQANSLNNPLTSALQAAWLAGCMEGRVKLPAPSCMLKDVQKEMKWVHPTYLPT